MSVTAATGGGLPPPPLPRGKVISPTAPRIAYLYSAPLIQRTTKGAIPVEPLDVTKERMQLKRVMHESNRQVVWSQAVATISNFRNGVTMGCRALHFTGHGKPGFVTFEDESGAMYLLNAAGLKELFEVGRGADGVKFVFVSACHSQDVGQAFVEAGVPHVVAVRTSDEVLDDASLLFSRHFYTSLLAGRSVQDAFDIARSVIKWDPSIRRNNEEQKFLLLGSGNHAEPIFADARIGQFIDASRPFSNRCDSVSDCFQGRGKEIHTAMHLLQTSRCVTIHGKVGIGKTQVALKLAAFAAERHRYADIFFIRLKNPEAGTAGLVRQFGTALGVTHSSAPAFFDAVHTKYSGSDGRSFLVIVDGCELFQNLEENSVREFLSRLAGKAGGLSFLTTSVTTLGFMHNLSEKPLPLGPLTAMEAAYLFIFKAPRKLRYHEMGLTRGDSLTYKEVVQSLARTDVLKALEGHPGAICQVAALLATHNKRDGKQYDLSVHKDDMLRVIIPHVLQKMKANSGKALFQMVGMAAPPTGRVDRSNTLPDVGKLALAASPVAVSRSAETPKLTVAPSLLARVQQLIPDDFDTREVWLAAHLAQYRQAGIALQSPSVAVDTVGTGAGAGAGAGAGSDAMPTQPTLRPQASALPAPADAHFAAYPTASASKVAPPLAGDASGAGADESDEMAAARASMPVGVPGGRRTFSSFDVRPKSLSEASGMPPPARPVLQHAASLAGASSTRGGSSNSAAPSRRRVHLVTTLPVADPVPWSFLADQLQARFLRDAPAAARSRPLSKEDLHFIATSRLSPVTSVSPRRGPLVSVDTFKQWWPKMRVWVQTVARLADLWACQSPQLIVGWINGATAVQMLQPSTEGTFLFRFSESDQKMLVLCLVKGPGPPLQILVHVLPTGFELMTGNSSSMVFSTLNELVMRYLDLHFLYPQYPKGAVFGEHGVAAHK